MRAAILAVGSELLDVDRLDTNSLRLTELLQRYGVELKRKSVVGDEEAQIEAEIRRMLKDFDLVLVSGGLGPTADDVTREAAAAAVDRRLVLDPQALADLEARFRHFQRRMPQVNRRQAELIEGAVAIPNPRGTAPGMHLELKGANLLLLPGVPAELEGIAESYLEPWLAARGGGGTLERKVLKVACVPESEVEERIAPVYQQFGRESISVLARPGEIHLHLKAAGGARDRHRRLKALEKTLRSLLGEAVYGLGEELSLEAVVGKALRRAAQTVSVAESCTGGLLAQRLTRIAGSSDYFLGGVIAYADAVKMHVLEVTAEQLAAHGAVSEEVARSMAVGVRRKLKSDYGIAITGVAGPTGGSANKPVGTVHVALAVPRKDETEHCRVRFPGDRERVRLQSAQLALEMLRRRLLGIAPLAPFPQEPNLLERK